MQPPSQATPSVPLPSPEVRAPWPDELPRLRYFLPEAFLYEDHPPLFVGTEGRVERIVGAGALVRRPLQASNKGMLYLWAERGAQEAAWVSAVAGRAIDRARAAGLAGLVLGQSFPEGSAPLGALTALGFQPEYTNEIYAVDARAMWERLQRLHERLRERRMLPDNLRLSTLQPALIEPVRRFLLEHLPASASAVALESEGYKPEHSLAMLRDGKIQGVLLCRRTGDRSFIGLRVVIPELRSGIGWANLVLLHASMGTTIQSGLAECHFEVNPKHNVDTRQMALLFKARLVGRRVILGMKLPKGS